MSLKELLIEYQEFDSLDDCPEIISILYDEAIAASKNSYSPYSNFKVGAGIELTDGSVYSASNQENKAFPSGLCAERTVLFYVNSIKPTTPVKRMVLVAFDPTGMTEEPVYPCGSCRQVMVETEDRFEKHYEIWMVGENRIVMVKSAADLLPFKFDFNPPVD